MFLWFDSLSLQTFCVVRSQNNSPEMIKLEEPPCITPPLPSVPELSLKAEVKGASNLPVLHHQSEAGQFFTSLFQKTHQFLVILHFLKFLIVNHLKRNDSFSHSF